MVNEAEKSVLQSIFRGVYCKTLTDDVKTRRSSLLHAFSESTYFTDEYAVLHSLIKTHARLAHDDDFLRMYMQTNRATITSLPTVDLAGYEGGAGVELDAFGEFVNSCSEVLRDSLAFDVTEDEFQLAMEKHRMLYTHKEAGNTYATALEILGESGVKIGREKYQGYADSKRFTIGKFSKLDSLNSQNSRRGIIVYGQNDDVGTQEQEPVKLVTTFGIPKLDATIGGIYEGDFCSLLAPSKGGKSRLSTYILHNALVNCGTNCLMWSVENGSAAWEALIRARHFDYLYNAQTTDARAKRMINNDMIRKGELTGDLKDIEAASWTDLRYNDSYGRLANLDVSFEADTFLDELEAGIRAIDAKFVCIDYLQLLVGSGRQSHADVVSEAYKKTLRFLKDNKIGGLFPAQIKQTALRGLGEDSAVETRDIAGESYEVIKTPDINIGMYATQEDLASGVMKLFSIPSRNSPMFNDIDLMVELGVSNFIQAPM